MPQRRRTSRAFTLVELLVVIGIIALLVGILLPVLARAKAAARRVACASNLHQVGLAIHTYASDFDGSIPYGPAAPPMSFFNFYPVTGNVTSLISIQSGAPCALGLMLKQQLSKSPAALFCPGTDQDNIAQLQLAIYDSGKGQAQSDFYYRHASGSDTFIPQPTTHLKLATLGTNSDGFPIRALAIDVNFIADPGLNALGIYTRSAHDRKTVNILFADGHVSSAPNTNDRFTVDSRVFLAKSFSFMLKALELADREN